MNNLGVHASRASQLAGSIPGGTSNMIDGELVVNVREPGDGDTLGI